MLCYRLVATTVFNFFKIKFLSESKTICRDYNDDIMSHIEAQNALFRAEHTALWQDHVPVSKAMEQAEATLDVMTAQSDKLEWDTFQLKLATDTATLGRLFEAENKTARARHLKKVCHLKEQTLH